MKSAVLNNIINETSPFIFATSETKCVKLSQVPTIDGFVPFSRYARSTGGVPSGGVTTFVADRLKYLTSVALRSRRFHILWTLIDLPDNPLYVCNVYAPQRGDREHCREFFAYLERSIARFSVLGTIVLLGDFNARTKDAGDRKTCTSGKLFRDMARNCNLRVLNDTMVHGVPTYDYRGTERSIIDYVLTSGGTDHWSDFKVWSDKPLGADRHSAHRTISATL